MSHHDEFQIETTAVHAGERRPGPEGSVVFPIYQGTVYSVDEGTDYHDIKYLRLNSTPSQVYLHDKLAILEGSEAALATASGMAAITAALHSVLRAGDHLLIGDTLYGGTHDFITHHAADNGWSYTFVDPHRPDAWEPAKQPNTKAFYVESITNPLMRVGRLGEVADFATEHGLVSIIDNTFATPVNFQPIKAGFDLSVHSATKYLNGHSDLVAGAVMGSADRVNAVRKTLNHYGGSLDAHAGFLLARGLKTLALRVKAQNANALALASALEAHPKVDVVNYPGLESHPDHEIARALFTGSGSTGDVRHSGFGGMLSIRPAGGLEAAKSLCELVQLPYSAPSLGGVESLITRPAVTSHGGMTAEARAAVGVTDDLVRISCGIEAVDDLVIDFMRALDKL